MLWWSMTSNTLPMADHTNQAEQDALALVAQEYPRTLDQISDLDDAKKPLTKKLSNHKSAVRKIMKRKLDQVREDNPDATSLTLQVGNTVFTLEEVVSYKACPVEEMDAFFSQDQIAKYKEAVENKRMKLSTD